MKAVAIWFVALMAAALAAGCGDENGPSVDPQFDEVVGAWGIKSFITGSMEYEVGAGGGYWYFSDAGEFCSMGRTAYEYVAENTGQLAASGFVLTEVTSTGSRIWELALSADGDTLLATAREHVDLAADGVRLVRSLNAPEPLCSAAIAP